MEERVDSCQDKHESTVLSSSEGDVIPELSSCPSDNLTISTNLKSHAEYGILTLKYPWPVILTTIRTPFMLNIKELGRSTFIREHVIIYGQIIDGILEVNSIPLVSGVVCGKDWCLHEVIAILLNRKVVL